MSRNPPMLRAPLQMALLALGTYVAFELLLPVVPLPRHRLPLVLLGSLVIISTAAFMLLQLWLAQAVVNLKPRLAVSAALVALFVALWIPNYLYLEHVRALHHPPPFLALLSQALIITLGGAFLGILLSRIIREANVLLPVALVAMLVDLVGAMTSIGFTQNVVASNPALVRGVSVPVPTVGSAGPHGGLHILGFIGPGDALFMAFFFAVALRLGLNVRGTFWWMYGLLTVTMLAVLFTGINIAALIPMGLAVLIANRRYFRLKREEIFATVYAALLILVLVGGFYLYSHAHFFRHSS